MKEIIEIRCGKEDFQEMRQLPQFDNRWCRQLGLTTIIRGISGDPQFDAFCDRLREMPRCFSFADVERTYDDSELSQSELLLLYFTRAFEPAGEECGTTYDESAVCPSCKAGRKRTSPLRLNVGRIPRGADLARTIAWDEWVVSDKTYNVLRRARVHGAEFRPVQHVGRQTKHKYFELVATSTVTLAPNSRFGIDPLDDDKDGKYVCPDGHTKGLSLVSEAYINRRSWDGSDIMRSVEYVGDRQGLLAPNNLLFISQKVYQLCQAEGIRGFKVEVAHLI